MAKVEMEAFVKPLPSFGLGQLWLAVTEEDKTEVYMVVLSRYGYNAICLNDGKYWAEDSVSEIFALYQRMEVHLQELIVLPEGTIITLKQE